MLALHPNILEKNGMKEFVVLPFEEFSEIKNELQDFENLKDLREAIPSLILLTYSALTITTSNDSNASVVAPSSNTAACAKSGSIISSEDEK